MVVNGDDIELRSIQIILTTLGELDTQARGGFWTTCSGDSDSWLTTAPWASALISVPLISPNRQKAAQVLFRRRKRGISDR